MYPHIHESDTCMELYRAWTNLKAKEMTCEHRHKIVIKLKRLSALRVSVRQQKIPSKPCVLRFSFSLDMSSFCFACTPNTNLGAEYPLPLNIGLVTWWDRLEGRTFARNFVLKNTKSAWPKQQTSYVTTLRVTSAIYNRSLKVKLPKMAEISKDENTASLPASLRNLFTNKESVPDAQ